MKQNRTFFSHFCMFLCEVIPGAVAIILWLVWQRHFFNNIEDNRGGKRKSQESRYFWVTEPTLEKPTPRLPVVDEIKPLFLKPPLIAIVSLLAPKVSYLRKVRGGLFTETGWYHPNTLYVSPWKVVPSIWDERTMKARILFKGVLRAVITSGPRALPSTTIYRSPKPLHEHNCRACGCRRMTSRLEEATMRQNKERREWPPIQEWSMHWNECLWNLGKGGAVIIWKGKRRL